MNYEEIRDIANAILRRVDSLEFRLKSIEERLWKAEVKDAVYGPIPTPREVLKESSGLSAWSPEIKAAIERAAKLTESNPFKRATE